MQKSKVILKELKDRLSDVDSIEDDGEAGYLLFIEKNPQKALEIMKPYFNGEKRGREIPHGSYFLFAKYYFKNGDLSQALKNAKMSLEWYDKDFAVCSRLSEFVCENDILYFGISPFCSAGKEEL